MQACGAARAAAAAIRATSMGKSMYGRKYTLRRVPAVYTAQSSPSPASCSMHLEGLSSTATISSSHTCSRSVQGRAVAAAVGQVAGVATEALAAALAEVEGDRSRTSGIRIWAQHPTLSVRSTSTTCTSLGTSSLSPAGDSNSSAIESSPPWSSRQEREAQFGRARIAGCTDAPSSSSVPRRQLRGAGASSARANSARANSARANSARAQVVTLSRLTSRGARRVRREEAPQKMRNIKTRVAPDSFGRMQPELAGHVRQLN